jgi:hypothetical protein
MESPTKRGCCPGGELAIPIDLVETDWGWGEPAPIATKRRRSGTSRRQSSQATTNTLRDVIGKPNPSERSAGEIKAKIQA